MSFWEILIVCLGLSLDVFAVAACGGAMLARIRPLRLLALCVPFSLWQAVAIELGRLVSVIPQLEDISAVTLGMWKTFSAIIFFVLAGLLFSKAVRNKAIFEHRSTPTFRQSAATAAVLSVDAFFAGFGTGLLNTPWLLTGCMLFAVSLVCLAVGILVGYHFGYEQKTKAYWVGGALFVAAGVDVIVQYLV